LLRYLEPLAQMFGKNDQSLAQSMELIGGWGDQLIEMLY
jgi:hypothetical protein